MVRKLFKVTAWVLAACVGTEVLTLATAYGLSLGLPHKAVSPTVMTPREISGLQADFTSILDQSAAHYVILGDTDHCDQRLVSFIKDENTIQILASHGFDSIFLEFPPDMQDSINSVAARQKTHLETERNSALCGKEIGDLNFKLTEELIQIAAQQHQGYSW